MMHCIHTSLPPPTSHANNTSSCKSDESRQTHKSTCWHTTLHAVRTSAVEEGQVTLRGRNHIDQVALVRNYWSSHTHAHPHCSVHTTPHPHTPTLHIQYTHTPHYTCTNFTTPHHALKLLRQPTCHGVLSKLAKPTANSLITSSHSHTPPPTVCQLPRGVVLGGQHKCIILNKHV